ncbi:MAG TPA: dephospho-CoA kinase [Candidatus Omnitrophota bacterium]|nr:dephospho-CoA kinase [Candidatus Omnitrophota bacterium]
MRTLAVGLTGGFATGKSTAAGMLKRRGAWVVDADRLAHRALAKGTAQYKAIVKKFGGKRILDPAGRISRKKLGEMVFSDPRKLRGLEAILHPFVFKEAEAMLKKSRKKITVFEVPLLFETRFDRRMDKTVVVACSGSEQIRRASKKHGLNAKEIRKRIKMQMPLGEKKRKADFVIENNKGLGELERKIGALWGSLNRAVSQRTLSKNQ